MFPPNRNPPQETPLPRVLVVDDDPSVRLACVMTLRLDGWQAAGEGSARTALGRLAGNREHFDVLVVDYAMPELDGLALLAELAPANRPPTLLASAQADGKVALAALRQGIWDFQAKPLVPEELRRRVRRLRRRSQEAANPEAWMHRALCRCQRCEWAEARRELQAWPEVERSESGQLVLGLVCQLAGDAIGASAAFRRGHWFLDWHRQGGEIWSELARRLD